MSRTREYARGILKIQAACLWSTIQQMTSLFQLDCNATWSRKHATIKTSSYRAQLILLGVHEWFSDQMKQQILLLCFDVT
ncbi:hypothetical protein V6Z12_A12G218400 [Gossypium hirsutum]